jgi:lipopolysaccharide transport system ATP-binding protein
LPTLPNGSVQVEQVWKKFRSDKTAPLFYDQMTRLTKRVSDRSKPGYRWVLKDVNFEVEPGESLALIGVNGSGKTTLLKILSQVTFQSAGRCDVAGRIGAPQRHQRAPSRPQRSGEHLPLRGRAGHEP